MTAALNVGDLVYLPAGHRLVNYADNQKTITQYCELSAPCVCLVVGVTENSTLASIFYRGKIWQSPTLVLRHYSRNRKKSEERVC